MYLKSIEVQGFKSFANKICFEFHNGITGIVGPNGSGKSNVADAVRWVLGEQSAKQLRGGNMQDVIFSGTENRKPLGFASVAITLDNSDHKLDIEYEEVTVTRRLYRSGESEYLLNGCTCRLKDINELFYDTGIGKEGYSIIGQGQIDKILSGKPEERRELFDEAAGIVKFKRRKNATLKKLAEEQQNLIRVTDILSELTRQIGPLERQSETARIFLKKKEELKQLEVNLFLQEMEDTSEKLKKLEHDIQIAEDELKETTHSFETTKKEYEILEQEMEVLDEKIEQYKECSKEQELKRQQMEGQINVLKEQINAAKQNDVHYKNRMTVLKEQLESYKKEAASFQNEKEQLTEQRLVIEALQQEKDKELKNLQSQIAQCQASIEENQTGIIHILNSRASTKGKIQRYDAMLEQIQIRKSGLNQKMLQMKTEELQQKERHQKYQTQFDEVSEKIDALTKKQEEMDEEIGALQVRIGEQNRQMDIRQTTYHREASRLESLKNLAERYEGFGGSIKRVMEQKDHNPGIKGVVAELIQTDKRFEMAVETALGGSIQNIVTDNESTAKYMIEYLKRGRYGRATFLPLTTVKETGAFSKPEIMKEEGVIGLANTLVRTEPVYRSLIANLLGKTVVVDHIDHAIALGRKYKHSVRMVTLDGDLLNPGGSMTGGAFKNNSNLLGRKREIDELEKNVRFLKKDMEKMQNDIDDNRNRRNQLRDASSDISDQIHEQRVAQNTARMNLKQTNAKLQEQQNEYGSIRGELQEIERQIKEIQNNQALIQTEIQESETNEKNLEQKTLNLQGELETQRGLEEEKMRELEEIHVQVAEFAQKEGFINENLARIHRESKACSDEMNELHTNIGSSSEQIKERESQIEQILEMINQAGDLILSSEEQIKVHTASKEEKSKTYKSFFDKRDQLSQKMNLLDKECFRLNNQREKVEESREGRIQYMWEEYEITPQSALSYRMEEELEFRQIKSRVSECKEEIRKLGPVNVNAIEDYKELKERHDFLQTQHSDLVEAEKTLQGIINELDEGMRKQFAEKFEDIRREFDKAFKQLFGGGKGTLELMDDVDILEAGIKIISQPPGKKLQNMMQLSGGEKALTAIALLFAIQNLKPSPFCLLDEIEAALDDSNVTRFAQYLHKLTKNTQFIIITHRRGTMTAADRLYGITMQEKGVSTLVSVSLIENDLDK